MKQTPVFDGRSFCPSALFQDGGAASQVDIGGRQVRQALVVVVIDECVDLLPEVTG